MQKSFFLLVLIALTLLSGCTGSKEEARKCKPPPQDFTEADIVGTWWAGYRSHPKVDDTLIIKEDGTYKQITFIEYDSKPDVNYESDWLPWYVEYSDDIPYLHMEELRLCAHAPDLRGCDQPGGGDYDPKVFSSGEWYDYCHDKWMVQKNEGILLITGALYDGGTTEGVELTSLAATPLDSWVYRLQRSELHTPTPP